jgi:hypothetical protein
MIDTKPWWASKGVIGGVVAMGASIFGMADTDAAQIINLLTELIAAAGGLLAVYGRIKATRAIK